MKKYQKIMIKTFITNIHFDEKLKEKLFEQYQKNQDVRNIILEMAIKLKDNEYLIKNQWSILKKFNLQEIIYIQESKILTESEKIKKKDIYKETIEKLTAAHINGFEPVFIIKTKIITKIQKKYSLNEDIINDLKDKLFTDLIEDEDEMVTKRNKEQHIVINKKIKI
jgi:hypothetical protein